MLLTIIRRECKIIIIIIITIFIIIFIFAFVVTVVIIISSRQCYCLNSNYVVFVECSFKDSHCSCVRSCCSVNVSFRLNTNVCKTSHRKCYVPCCNGPAAAVATRTLNKNGFTATTSFLHFTASYIKHVLRLTPRCSIKRCPYNYRLKMASPILSYENEVDI